jgi:hypothetical protein
MVMVIFAFSVRVGLAFVKRAARQIGKAADGGLKPVPDRNIRFASPMGESAIDLRPLFAGFDPQP